MSELLTYFAPAERSTDDEIRVQHESFKKDECAFGILEAMPDPAMVLNANRQVVATNTLLLKILGIDKDSQILGLRPGELLGCIHSRTMAAGCGTSESCRLCGAVRAILGCQEDRTSHSEECRVSRYADEDGGTLDLLVHAKWLSLSEGDHILVDLRDISAEKRRQVLEKVFFHDVVNTASGIRAIAELMSEHPKAIEGERDRYEKDLCRLADQMIDEIVAQRALLAAEKAELQPVHNRVQISEIVEDVVGWYRHSREAKGKKIVVDEVVQGVIVTDRMLLRRSLGNLIKNALEATASGGEVGVGVSSRDEGVAFTVTNSAVMSDDVQRQIFQRSFSTKGGHGRGIGTYSIKLFVENYLGGKVSFTSSAPKGTSFTITVPNDLTTG